MRRDSISTASHSLPLSIRGHDRGAIRSVPSLWRRSPTRGFAAAGTVGRFEILGCRVLVLVSADFWYSDVFVRRLRKTADLILVRSFSIRRRSSPRAQLSLWRSMAIARAYEFSVYLGISDSAQSRSYNKRPTGCVPVERFFLLAPRDPWFPIFFYVWSR